MVLGDRLLDNRILLLALAQPDALAILGAMGEAGMVTLPCTVASVLQEARVGVGAIVIAEEAMSGPLVRTLVTLIDEQPIWSDIPLIILTSKKLEASEHWRPIRNAHSIRNATFLERPMRITTLLQAMKVALRGREKQYHLRDQLRERDQLLALSEKNAQHLAALLDNTRMAVFFMDDRQHCTFMNAAAENMTGYSLLETDGQSLHATLHHTYPDGRPYPQHECPIDRALPDSKQTEGEEVFVHKDGHFYPVAFTASPIRNEDGVVGTVIELRNIAKEKADTERLHMLLGELNHRVKNMLVNVQSIFVQTLQGEVISDHVKDAVMSRLKALSSSHDLLTEQNWVGAPLGELARRALAPFDSNDASSGRIVITGDEFILNPQTSLAMAMGLHELATNAVKYGSLSRESGSVALSWKLVAGDILQVNWVEQGGPAVVEPVRSGFGRRLIERGLAHELGGEARIDFYREGVKCEINIPTATAMVTGKSETIG